MGLCAVVTFRSFWELNSGLPPAQNLHFCCKIKEKTAFWLLGGSDGLRTGLLGLRTGLGARRLPDGPPGAQDRTDLLTPQIASDGLQTASGQISWRPRPPPDGPLGVGDGLRTDLPAPSGPSAPMLFCLAAYRLASSHHATGSQ